ncbi:MAG TPA: rhodanese-like domain-containing protein [Flavobacteriaceae bacterium]|nr:rhodanese-like domain-containing protein [Flavobacteriaceae bacterium]
MGLLGFLFGYNDKKIKNYLKRDAILLDVRTEKEFKANSLPDSKNIPLPELHNHVDQLKQMNKPFIVYCESGVRSAKAVKFLNLNNIDAVNGGGHKKIASLTKEV